MLKAIAAREYPIPEHVDIYLLNEGAPPSELGALEWVVKEAEKEMERLDKLAEHLLEEEGPDSPVLMDIYEVCITQSLLELSTRDANHLVFFSSAHGQDGPLHLLHPSLPHSDRSRLQQDYHPQEDQGHVRWLAYARRPRQGRHERPPPH